MKKVFPLIVVLISLSVIGILFIQMSWINNAMKLKKDEFQRELEISMVHIREDIRSRFLEKQKDTYLTNTAKENWLRDHFTSQQLKDEEVEQIIRKNIKENNIKYKYEYCILNIFSTPLFISPGFKMSDLHVSHQKELTNPDSYMNLEKLYIYINEDKNVVIREMWGNIAASIVFTTIIIMAFFVTVRTLFNQKKLSEIKSDFINNMTHELKTPLATISLAIDALTNEKVIHDTEKIKIYSSMIKEENRRMNKQVEKILQSARLEKEDLNLSLQKLDAHQIINKVANNILLQIQEKSGTLTLKLNATSPAIEADEVHFSNIIFNLLDNAMKYSEQAPHIEVQTLNNGNGTLSIKIKDNGIGMDKETQARIFEKFYRAHTGNLHNVKGFGLGLSYVKAIVDAHDGKIKVESAPGKGSTFTLIMPAVS